MMSASLKGLAAGLHALQSRPPTTWQMRGSHARPGLHALMRYPAMMSPAMQGDILDVLLSHVPTPQVLDPFVGSGTTLTEALHRGLAFTGIDINPLAGLLCEAKAGVHRGADVGAGADRVERALNLDRGRRIDVDFPNLEKWFSEEAARALSRIRRSIQSVPNRTVRLFFWSVFAETIRLCSNSRTSTYKLHIRPNQNGCTAGDVLETFRRQSSDAVDRARWATPSRTSRADTGSIAPRIVCGDSRTVRIPLNGDAPVAVVTSPPYGENVSTIPYGQFSYLALRWIPLIDLPRGSCSAHISNTHALDTASLGGSSVDWQGKCDSMRLISPAFDEFMDVAERNGRTRLVRKSGVFVFDFCDTMQQVAAVSRSPQYWILTVGNRRVAGIELPLDRICRDIAQFFGGKHIYTLRRTLPVKRMPLRNSEGQMITRETVLVTEIPSVRRPREGATAKLALEG